MTSSFFFYDLETSGFRPGEARVMQFGGQRTSLDLKPLGPSYNQLIKITDDVLPDPDAILVTRITPQKTLAQGITEAQFLQMFHKEIALPGTIFVGFNNVRFDDEFMRYLHYRNFYDPYEWQWRDKRSRWDLLDMVRMTRALRPEGIKWPFDSTGKPTNRLTLLTSMNGLDHAHAHDALSDVQATIELARLIYVKQPKLFEFLLKHRDKKAVMRLVNAGQPFVYSSGKYDSQYHKTTVAGVVATHPNNQGVFVFDLRFNPLEYVNLTPHDLADAWLRRGEDEGPRLPVKLLKYNRCPAVAPLGVLDTASVDRLAITHQQVQQNFAALQVPVFQENILAALELLDKKQQTRLLQDETDIDTQLYEDFFTEYDHRHMETVRAADLTELANLKLNFRDQRLEVLLPLYKARNFPQSLSALERKTWSRFRQHKLFTGYGQSGQSRLERYFTRISELEKDAKLKKADHLLLKELRQYGERLSSATYE